MRSGIIGIKRGSGSSINNTGRRVLKSKRGGESNKIRKWWYNLNGSYLVTGELLEKKRKRLGIVKKLAMEWDKKSENQVIILSNKNMVGDIVKTGRSSGNIMKLQNVGIGSTVFDISGKYGRSSNSWCTVVLKSNGKVLVRLKSGIEKWFDGTTIVRSGVVSMVRDGVKSAGSSSRRGVCPKVSGLKK